MFTPVTAQIHGFQIFSTRQSINTAVSAESYDGSRYSVTIREITEQEALAKGHNASILTGIGWISLMFNLSHRPIAINADIPEKLNGYDLDTDARWAKRYDLNENESVWDFVVAQETYPTNLTIYEENYTIYNAIDQIPALKNYNYCIAQVYPEFWGFGIDVVFTLYKCYNLTAYFSLSETTIHIMFEEPEVPEQPEPEAPNLVPFIIAGAVIAVVAMIALVYWYKKPKILVFS
jgi:hypothetical protein